MSGHVMRNTNESGKSPLRPCDVVGSLSSSLPLIERLSLPKREKVSFQLNWCLPKPSTKGKERKRWPRGWLFFEVSSRSGRWEQGTEKCLRNGSEGRKGFFTSSGIWWALSTCGIVTKEEKTFSVCRCEDDPNNLKFLTIYELNIPFVFTPMLLFRQQQREVLRYRLGHLRDDSDARLQSEIAIDSRVSGKNEGVAGVHKKAVRRLAT